MLFITALFNAYLPKCYSENLLLEYSIFGYISSLF